MEGAEKNKTYRNDYTLLFYGGSGNDDEGIIIMSMDNNTLHLRYVHKCRFVPFHTNAIHLLFLTKK